MVQTEQQYICIHQCLMAVLEGKENTAPPREIHDNQGYEGKCHFKIMDNFLLSDTCKLSNLKKTLIVYFCYHNNRAILS